MSACLVAAMTSNPNFNADTTATEAAGSLKDSIRSKVVVITGVSPASIGATTALAIASQAPKALVLASRTASKIDAVAADIAEKHPDVAVHKVILDLSSIDSIKAAAAQIDSLVDHVDVLINNAGINSRNRNPVKTPGDTVVDLTFFTNHLGPFLFTHLLTPKLRAAAAAAAANTTQASPTRGATRIINLSSHGHRLSPVRFYDYQIAHYVYDGVPESQKPPKGLPEGFLATDDEGYPNFIGYGQSKTANILHATELTRRFRRRGDDILALSLHPGTIRTELSRGMDEAALRTIDETAPAGQWKTLDQGAATTVVAAFDPKLADLDMGGGSGKEEEEEEISFGYLADCQLADEMLADYAKDAYNAQQLYDESERMLLTRTGLAPVQ